MRRPKRLDVSHRVQELALALLAGASLFVSVGGLAFAAPIGSGVARGVNGVASWYGAWHEGRTMANGKPFRAGNLTAASPVLPIGAWVRVRRHRRSVVVQITDRGPYAGGRMIDLSRAAAERLDMIAAGIVAVSIERIRAPARASRN